MLISDVCAAAGLTKKAVEYYLKQGMICPGFLENGYRDFSAGDVEKLKNISLLRRLGLGVEDIRSALADESGETMRRISVRNSIRLQKETLRQTVLDRLSAGRGWDDISGKLEPAEEGMTVAERLLEAFPGYYGRFLSLHFAQFLDMPIETHGQREAYETIISFLDNAPAIEFPEEVREYLEENTKELSVGDMAGMSESMRQSLRDPEAFFSENRDTLESYFAYKQSDEYKRSPAYKLETLLKEFNTASGYYDVFIPAMKALSPAYAEYHKQLETAGNKLPSFSAEGTD
jgi:DNA-binding transcriptional MerR regulator